MQYVAFLRGINVGGNTKVPMIDLKKAFEDLGYTDVKTVLNSGNVIFFGDEKKSSKIEEKLEKVFGFKIFVVVRTADQIKKLISSTPFKATPQNPNTKLYVTFLSDQDICNVINISEQKGTTDMMKNLEKEHGKMITTRNWNTVLSIGKLLQ
jgi:uncharacterized protein (DUF1697 family)